MAIRQIVLAGDSLTEGDAPAAGLGYSTAQGGQGAWWEFLAEGLANISGVGPLVSSGIRCTYVQDNEWTITGSWSTVAYTDAFDVAPYGDDSGVNVQFGMRYGAAGATAIMAWAKPSEWRPVLGVAIYYVDLNRLSGIQGGNWSYRINGGTWTAMGQTIAHDNKLAKFYVSGSGTPITAVDIRAADASGTAVAVFPVGVEAFYIEPTPTTSGLIIHNLARNGWPLDYLTTTNTAGDRMAFFDSVKIDSVHGGGAISNVPNAGVSVMHGNDIRIFNDTALWNTDLTTFYNRVHTFGPVVFMNHYELAQFPDEPGSDSPGYPWVNQANYRAQTKSTAAVIGSGVTVFDLFDEWTNLGIGTGTGTQNLAARAIGFVLSNDNGHEMQAGHIDLGLRIYWFFRTRVIRNVAPATNSFKMGVSAVGASDALVGATGLIINSTGAVPIASTPVA